jgi:hypothetical protein
MLTGGHPRCATRAAAGAPLRPPSGRPPLRTSRGHQTSPAVPSDPLPRVRPAPHLQSTATSQTLSTKRGPVQAPASATIGEGSGSGSRLLEQSARSAGYQRLRLLQTARQIHQGRSLSFALRSLNGKVPISALELPQPAQCRGDCWCVWTEAES